MTTGMPKQDSQFKPGQSGNPLGRPRGSRNQSTMAAEFLLQGEAEAITRKCADLAKQGDPTALKLCISRLIPVRRERAIKLALPPIEGAQDTLRAIGTVLEAVGSAEITPAEGTAVAKLLEVHRTTFEIVELEQRIERLEAKQCGAP